MSVSAGDYTESVSDFTPSHDIEQGTLDLCASGVKWQVGLKPAHILLLAPFVAFCNRSHHSEHKRHDELGM